MLQVGDKIKISKHDAEVIKVTEESYTVKFDDPDLIPQIMDYERWYIDSKNDKCPNCKTKWTVTKFNRNTWYDCKPCGKTRETIISESPPPVPEPDMDEFLKKYEEILWRP